MSDRYTGGNGPPDDLYRYSGPGNGNNDGQQGDLYRFSGPNNNRDVFHLNSDGDNGSGDPFANDRMPGRQRPSDNYYGQEYHQRFTAPDGTVIINNVYARNAYFNQNPVSGADFRTDPNMDFRNMDPACRNLQQRDQSSYYNNNNGNDSDYNYQPQRPVSSYNGSFRTPPLDQSYQYDDGQQYYPNDNGYSQIRRGNGQDFESAARARERAAYERSCREQGIDIVGHNYGGHNGMGQDYESANEKRCRAAVERQLREQMYQQNCQNVNDAGPIYQNQPYYSGNQGYHGGNGGVGVRIGIHNGGGSPCFGQDRTRISANVRLPGGIRIGGDF